MQDSFDITTLIFLVLAVFVIWRLRSVLGQKTGSEQPPFDPLLAPRFRPAPGQHRRRAGQRGPPARCHQDGSATAEGPAAERWKGIAEPGQPAWPRPSTEIARAEPSFDAAGFLDGAKAAYEMIVTAFAQGDRKTLKDLLSQGGL